MVNWKVKAAPNTCTMRHFGLISYRKFPEKQVFFILNPDFHWVDGDPTTGIWPHCSTEDLEYGDLRSSREPWEPTLPNGELKRRTRRLLADDLAAPTPWQLPRQYGLGPGGRTAGRRQLGGQPAGLPAAQQKYWANSSRKLSHREIFFAALHMSDQSSFWPQ